MPRGTYLVNGRSEAFSCAPGPAGWRYVSTVLDLACDAAFGVVRFEVRGGSAAAGAPWARGGRVSLDDGRRVLGWACSADPERERVSDAARLDTASPGAVVALLRSVAAPGDLPVRRLVPVVRFEEPALAGLEARRVVSRTAARWHDAPLGQLLVEEWHVDDPDAGTRLTVHLAGDVVLSAQGPEAEVELTSLESPPTGTPGPAGPGTAP